MALSAFVVVAFVVLALSVTKFPVVPHSVAMLARVELNAEIIAPVNDAKEPTKPVEVVVAETDKLVAVAFVIVPLLETKFVFEIFVEERFVEVELVIVPFATSIEGSDKFVTERFVTVAFVRVAFEEVK